MRKNKVNLDEEFIISDEHNVYSKEYNEYKFQKQPNGVFVKIGMKIAYFFSLILEIMKSPKIPFKTKATIAGGLLYFVSPLDFIPDFIPFIGLTDDISLIAIALFFAYSKVDYQMKENARSRVDKWFLR